MLTIFMIIFISDIKNALFNSYDLLNFSHNLIKHAKEGRNMKNNLK